MANKKKAAALPDPLQSGHTSGRSPETAERMPGHTEVHELAAKEKAAAREVDDELDDALEHTFPASDPISLESTLVPGSRR
jgi:hypothetical protein